MLMFSHVRLFVTTWTIAHQASLSMEFFRQEYGVGCHFLHQGIFLTRELNPGVLHLLHWQADSLPLDHLGSPNKIRRARQFLRSSLGSYALFCGVKLIIYTKTYSKKCLAYKD